VPTQVPMRSIFCDLRSPAPCSRHRVLRGVGAGHQLRPRRFRRAVLALRPSAPIASPWLGPPPPPYARHCLTVWGETPRRRANSRLDGRLSGGILLPDYGQKATWPSTPRVSACGTHDYPFDRWLMIKNLILFCCDVRRTMSMSSCRSEHSARGSAGGFHPPRADAWAGLRT
jgi:hypothetical protein